MEDMNKDEIRQMYDILKQQLAKQEIISDHMLRKTMKVKNSAISQSKRMIYVCTAICLLLYPLCILEHVWSIAFGIATCIMVLFCAVATYYIHKPVESLNFMKDDLATVARVMAKFKKQYDNWLHYVTPAILIPWLAWACYEFAWKNAPKGVNPWILTTIMLIGVLVGGLIGYAFHRRATNAAQDIIDEIETV